MLVLGRVFRLTTRREALSAQAMIDENARSAGKRSGALVNMNYVSKEPTQHVNNAKSVLPKSLVRHTEFYVSANVRCCTFLKPAPVAETRGELATFVAPC